MADCGLLLRKLGLSYKNILEENLALSSFKGAVTENFVLQELKGQNKNPYFWRSGNTAELDFLYEKQREIIPVEVKAATNTQAKSFKQFCKKFQNKTGFKRSLKNIAVNDCEGTKTVSLPLYLVWNIDFILQKQTSIKFLPLFKQNGFYALYIHKNILRYFLIYS